jgi:cellulose synthase/poly-beta-1,6-N-acetylglucosamine synthase-like glycosyltransferase
VAVTRAADVAGGDVLILSDANNHYVADTLRALVAPFADPEVGVVAVGSSSTTGRLGRETGPRACTGGTSP